MKKYIKPVMESESFVANEYIGACWTVTCHGKCGAGTFVTLDEQLYKDITSSSNSGNGYIYTGDLVNKSGKVFAVENCESFTQNGEIPDWVNSFETRLLYWLLQKIFGENETTTYYHPVSVTQKGVSDGPNAS